MHEQDVQVRVRPWSYDVHYAPVDRRVAAADALERRQPEPASSRWERRQRVCPVAVSAVILGAFCAVYAVLSLVDWWLR